jgi:hypothetical protein
VAFLRAERTALCSSHVVSEALKARTAEAVNELRSLEVVRLDNLQQRGCGRKRPWKAMCRPPLLLVDVSRCRLLGLDGPSLLEVKDARPRRLVVPPET